MQIRDVSARIDGCAGLIAQKAYATFSRLSPDNKRWMDEEDLVQEGLLAAFQAEQTFDDTMNAKFSTYLYKGLDFGFSRSVTTPLRQQKRSMAHLVELDAPMSSEDARTHDIEVPADVETNISLISSTYSAPSVVVDFIAVCRKLSPKAFAILVGGIITGTWSSNGGRAVTDAIYLEEIRKVAGLCNVYFNDLLILSQSEKNRKKVLTLLSESDTMGVGTQQLDARVLQCVRCGGLLYLSSIAKGRYFVSTMTCRSCHQQMQSAPPEESCFGKGKTKNAEGYSASDAECRLHCRDRSVCRQFLEESSNMVPNEAAAKAAVEDVDLSDVEVPTKKSKPETTKTTKSAGKAPKAKAVASPAKEAKPPKAAKTEAKAEEPEEEAGPDLPFKAGSLYRWLIEACIDEPRKEAWLKKQLVETSGIAEDKWPAYRKVLLQGHNGKGKTMEPTHTWKSEIANGMVTIEDMKRVGTRGKVAKKKSK